MGVNTVKLIKPPHRFELAYEAGGEMLALDVLIEWVPNLPFGGI
jgi:hypothetical protein